MARNFHLNALILGSFFCFGIFLLGYQLSKAAIEFKQLDRSVTVKGLSEKEFPADIVIWPIQFTVASNDLTSLYNRIQENTSTIETFLLHHGILKEEITLSPPAIIDKSAQEYGNNTKAMFRYTATQTVTVYSKNIETVRSVMNALSEIGKKGIVLRGDSFGTQTEYLFTRLNEVKPAMIEEATKKAREVAEKFAADSHSQLGKIKKAYQGRFTVSARDKNNPQMKTVRVVSTVEYYLSD